MATVLHPDPQRFPTGATVKAYKRSNFPGIWDLTGAPAGSQDASATVASDGSVTFTGLADDTAYVLYAASPDRYSSFRTKKTDPIDVRHGTGAPGASVGVDGDYYIDDASGNIYGPKAAGAWPGVSNAAGAGGSSVDPTSNLVLPSLFTQPTGTTTVTANRIYGCRVIVPKSGNLRDIAVPQNTPSGNYAVGVYDAGQAAGTVRTRLYDSGSVASSAGTNAWKIVADPNLAVTAGQLLDLVFQADNAVAVVLTCAPTGAPFTLPAGFMNSLVTTKLSWQSDPGSFTRPATIAEASAVVWSGMVPLLARIS